MQLTRFDRWLRKLFVYETHIYTLSDPGDVPRGVNRKPLPEQPGRRFNHLFVIRDEKLTDMFLTQLKAGNQMFTTRIVDRNAWYIPIIAPQGKSFTWKLVWLLVGGAGAIMVVRTLKKIWDNPEVQQNLIEALQILKG